MQKKGEGLMLLFGAILFVQGFGSAVTDSGWGVSFGVAALLREAGMPGWGDLVIGGTGCVFLALGAWRRLAARRDPVESRSNTSI
ncbi:hypothetical protein [Streptomyces silvensis]|uniref:Uncharacterized protein n=1 Tax=Streptomyces silvensis TaxID=1765722 RepID=A0A0W7WVD6_9ACTN|nr:hypothetical protein [Streptomyces silvensis]KUF14571.1 hypothetical protein AT728_28470 [Streptomyces silvensis]